MKYRHVRRTVIAALATFAFLLLIAGAVVVVLQSVTVRGWTKSAVERYARDVLGAETVIDDLTWGFLPPRVLLSGVRLESAGLVVEVHEFGLDVLGLRVVRRALDLGSVSARGVRITMQAPSGERRPAPDVRVSARHLDLRDVQFVGRDFGALRRLELTDLDLSWVRVDGVAKGYLTAAEAGLEVAGLERIECRGKARFEIHDRLVLPYWRAEGPGFDLEGSAVIDVEGGDRARATGRVDLGHLDRVIRTDGLLQGEVGIDARFADQEDQWLRIAVTAPEVDIAGFTVADLDGDLALAGDGLTGRVHSARFADGRLAGRYRLERFGPPYPHQVDATLDGAALAAVLEALHVPPAGLGARADIEAGLSWNGRRIGAGRGLATARLDRDEGVFPVAGEVRVALDGNDLLNFASHGLTIGEAPVQWQGPLTIGSWAPAWSVRAENAPIDEWAELVNGWIGDEVVPVGAKGIARIESTLAGPWQRLRVSTRVDVRDFSYQAVVLDRVVADVEIGESRLVIDPGRYQLGDGSGSFDGVISWRDVPAVIDLDVRGQAVPLGAMQAWFEQPIPIVGRTSFTGAVRGTVDRPRGSWAVGLVDVEVAGVALGHGSTTVELEGDVVSLQGFAFENGLVGRLAWNPDTGDVDIAANWPGVPLRPLGDVGTRVFGAEVELDTELRLREGRLPDGRLRLSSEAAELGVVSEDGRIVVSGRVGAGAELEAELAPADGGGVEGSGHLELTNVASLLEALLPGTGIPLRGRGDVELGFEYTADGAAALVGRFVDVDMVLDDRNVVQNVPTELVLDKNGLRLEGGDLDIGTDRLRFSSLVEPDGSLSGTFGGTLDALLLRIMAPAWETAGRLSGELELFGRIDEPRLRGLAEIAGGSFRIPGSHSVFSGLDGMVVLSADDVVLEGVDFRFLNGAGRAGGRIAFEEGDVVMALNGSVQGLTYPLFEGLAPQMSGTWHLRGTVGDLELSGDMRVDRAALQRRDDLTEIALDWIEQSASSGSVEGIELDVHLDADRSIVAQSPSLNAEASASLDLIGRPDQLSLLGNLELHEGGDFTFQGVRYEIEKGSIAFTDPSRPDRPIIDFEARAWVQSYIITVRLNGALDRLAVAVSSDPPLDPEGIYSLLSLGSSEASIGTGGFGVGLASTVLTRQINSELARRASLLLPVDQVRVDPFVESSTGNPAARMTVTKQLNPKWTIILQSNLSSDREEVIISRWYLAPGVFIEAIRDLDETFGVDLKVRKRY